MTRIDDIAHASDRLQEIAERCHEAEVRFREELQAVHHGYSDSARNLVHYVALRSVDIRDLQELLAGLGLSSLDRAERDVLASVRSVQAALASMAGQDPPGSMNPNPARSGCGTRAQSRTRKRYWVRRRKVAT